MNLFSLISLFSYFAFFAKGYPLPVKAAYLEHFQFETRCVSNHTACRFAEKARFFRSLWAGRRCAAASRFTFFKGKTLYGTVFSRPCRLALLWSCAILIVSVLTIWGLLMLSQYRIKALEQEISNLSARREQLEAQNASLWNSFKELEPYQAEGRAYLLTPAGQQIVHAGKVGQRDAWEVVRR